MASFSNSEQISEPNSTNRENIIHSFFQNKSQITPRKIRSISCSSIIKALAIKNLVHKIPDSARNEKTSRNPFQKNNEISLISTLPTSDELNMKYLQLKSNDQNSSKKKKFHRKFQSSIFLSNLKLNSFQSKLKDNNFPIYSKNSSPVSKLNMVSGFLSPSRSNPRKTNYENESKIPQNKRKSSICKKNRQYVLLKNNEKEHYNNNEIDCLAPKKLSLMQGDLKKKTGHFFSYLILYYFLKRIFKLHRKFHKTA